MIWFVCQKQSSSSAYSLDLATTSIIPLETAHGSIWVSAAPVGNKAVLTAWEPSASRRVSLYEGGRKICDLPVDNVLAWSADAKKIYFEAGSTIQGDAWDTLGILTLDDMSITRKKLLALTESVNVCAADGRLFTGDPIVNEDGDLEAETVEYGPNLETPRRIPNLLPGNFSATCRYIATESSFHGPLPWAILDVATGGKLMTFDFTGEGRKEEFEFHSWNPKYDELLLRVADHPLTKQGEILPSTLQVFDVERNCVLSSIENSHGVAEWSSDGERLILAKSKSLTFSPISKRAGGFETCPNP